jgi:hypothetical protein
MGRAILLIVILISTIYAGIILNVQKEMYKLPEVIKENFTAKEIENVSDYALRAAVRLGTEQPEFRIPPGDSTLTIFFDGATLANHFPVYRQYVSDSTGIYYDIKKIKYTKTRLLGDDEYEAVVTIDRPLQTPYDAPHTYTAQIGYNYPDVIVDGPLVLYGDYGAQFHIPELVEDQSSQIPPTIGYLFGIGATATNVIKLNSKGVWGNGSGHKCFNFGFQSANNGSGNTGCGIQVPNPLDAANYATLINRLKCYNEFTVSCYAQIEQMSAATVNLPTANQPNGTGGNIVNNNGNCGTLIWFASNPNNSKYDQVGYTRPSIALWHDNYQSSTKTVTMHYGITIDNFTANGTYREITKTGVPTFVRNKLGGNSAVWHMFTMTFLNGTLTAYYDNTVVGTLTALGGNSIKHNDYGFTVGIRDIRADTPTPLCPTHYRHPGTNYMCYNGLLDYYSYWDIALTPDQINDWYNGTIGRTVKNYIRD